MYSVRELNHRIVRNTKISETKYQNFNLKNKECFLDVICKIDGYNLEQFNWADYMRSHAFTKTGLKFDEYGRAYISLNRREKKMLKDNSYNVKNNYLCISYNPVDKLMASTAQEFSSCITIPEREYSGATPLLAACYGIGIIYLTSGSFGKFNYDDINLRSPKINIRKLIPCSNDGVMYNHHACSNKLVPTLNKKKSQMGSGYYGGRQFKDTEVNNLFCSLLSYTLGKVTTKGSISFDASYLSEIDNNSAISHYFDFFDYDGDTGYCCSGVGVSMEDIMNGKTHLECECCGCAICDDDAIWVNDAMYCDACATYCDKCGNAMLDDCNAIHTRDGSTFCDSDCANDAGYRLCDYCKEWYPEDDVYSYYTSMSGDIEYFCHDCRDDTHVINITYNDESYYYTTDALELEEGIDIPYLLANWDSEDTPEDNVERLIDRLVNVSLAGECSACLYELDECDSIKTLLSRELDTMIPELVTKCLEIINDKRTT